MYLTKEEELMLAGEHGEAIQLAMKVIVRVGEALGAERLVKITHAHASGISYLNISEEGFSFITNLARKGGRVRVFSTFNPIGQCLCPNPLINNPIVLRKQSLILKALLNMGFKYSATCTPYFLRKPKPGEHLSWGESSAVAVANSIYGARTNREGGPLALASALTGRTYYWGLHIPGNRRPTIIVRIEKNVDINNLVAGLIGYLIGLRYPGEIPYIEPSRPLNLREAYQLCAAAAASGNTSMCIIKGLSIEDKGSPSRLRVEVIGENEINLAYEELSTADPSEAEAFFTGCPHLGPSEAKKILLKVIRRGIILRKPLWIALPGYLTLYPEWIKLSRKLHKHNITLFFGTCPVVSNIKDVVRTIATDSVKTAFYLPR
ncbi:MAG: aconitase X catalytic domain-containing protein, partial [Pyrodictiaceae archaeon]